MKRNWKLPVIIALALLLAVQMIDAAWLLWFGGSCRLPILMYHHFAEKTNPVTTVTPEQFREQLTALKEAGYQTVTVRQVIDYAESGAPLPDKPILITIDDGYTSNLTEAAPILEELGMCATVFVIGINEGEEISPHSGQPMKPSRFSYEEALPWVEKGVLDVQSHTYDMHQRIEYGYRDRDGVLRKDGESHQEYRQALLEDARMAFARREGRGLPTELVALAYPYGFFSMEADGIFREAGYRLTVTTQEHVNRLYKNNDSCLRMLGRFNVNEAMTGEILLDRIQ